MKKKTDLDSNFERFRIWFYQIYVGNWTSLNLIEFQSKLYIYSAINFDKYKIKISDNGLTECVHGALCEKKNQNPKWQILTRLHQFITV